MKKIIALLMVLSTGKVSLAQTNIFPANGNVGIGISNSPTSHWLRYR